MNDGVEAGGPRRGRRGARRTSRSETAMCHAPGRQGASSDHATEHWREALDLSSTLLIEVDSFARRTSRREARRL